MDSNTDTITIYSDYVCPFCYLGRRSLDQYQATRDEELEIDWRPFDLRAQKRGPDGEIDTGVDDGKDDAYFEQAKQNVRRLQERYDADMALEIATDVDSLNAQIASNYVRENHSYEEWLDLDEAIFAALWQEQRDVGDPDVLAALAEDVGLDGDDIRTAIADDEVRATVEEQFADAHQRGITGVPTFVYENHAARGAVPPAQLERLVEGTDDA